MEQPDIWLYTMQTGLVGGGLYILLCLSPAPALPVLVRAVEYIVHIMNQVSNKPTLSLSSGCDELSAIVTYSRPLVYQCIYWVSSTSIIHWETCKKALLHQLP